MKKISISILCARHGVISANPHNNSVEQAACHFVLWAGEVTLDPLACDEAVVGPGPCSSVPRPPYSTVLGEGLPGSLGWGAGVEKMTGREAGMNKLKT